MAALPRDSELSKLRGAEAAGQNAPARASLGRYAAAVCFASMGATWGIGAALICRAEACGTESLDARGLFWFAGIRSDLLDFIFGTLTWAGSLSLLIPGAATVVVLLLRAGRVREAVFTSLSLAGISGMTHLVKLAVARPRPAWYEAVTSMPPDLSFPSAHAAQITAFVIACIIVFKRLHTPRIGVIAAAAGAVLIALVCTSRLYLQVHFPSDVLAGALAAALWVAGLGAMLPPAQGRMNKSAASAS
ncbi:MAG: phosphatase PAP2 family protein [Burkholderiales bacterium]